MQSRQKNQKGFVELLRIQKNIFYLLEDGLKVIQNSFHGRLSLISIEGGKTDLFSRLLQTKQVPKINSHYSSIYISSQSIKDQQTKSQYYFLLSLPISQQDQIKLHMFLSIISTIIIINITQSQKLTFLTSLNGRIIVNSKNQHTPLKQHIASIFGIFRQNGLPDYFIDHTKQFMNVISKAGIIDYVKINYDCLGAIAFPKDQQLSLKKYQDLPQLLFHKLKQQEIIKQNIQLMYGPVLKSYMEKIIQQINKKSMVILQIAEENIQVQEGYQAFTNAIDRYHIISKQKFRDRPINNVNQIFMQNRKKAQDKFHQISSDGRYLSKMHNYIDKKQQQLRITNNKLYDEYNYQLLKRQSQVLIKKINNNDGKDMKFIKDDVDLIVKKYQRQAGGDNKHKLLTQYLNNFVPSLYNRENNNQQLLKMLEKQNKQNQMLKTRLKEIQKKDKMKQKDSSCCTIM